MTAKVVVIGAGCAGLSCAKSLSNTKVDVFLIDKTNHHLFSPLLSHVTSSALSQNVVATPLRDIFSFNNNINPVNGEVTDINLKEKRVILKNNQRIDYDFLVIATGTKAQPQSNNVMTLSNLSDALIIRDKILHSLERAERNYYLQKETNDLNFAIVGNDFLSIELAGILSDHLQHLLLTKFSKIKSLHPNIYLISPSTPILQYQPSYFTHKIQRFLESKGVKVITNKNIKNISSTSIELDDLIINTTKIIWTLDQQGASFLSRMNIPLNKDNKVIVETDLSIPNYPEVFVIGSSAYHVNTDGNYSDFTFSLLKKQGNFVAEIIHKGIPPHLRLTFKVPSSMYLMNIAKYTSVFSYKKLRFIGLLPWVVRCMYLLTHIHGYLNKIRMAIFWFFPFIPQIIKNNHLLDQHIDE